MTIPVPTDILDKYIYALNNLKLDMLLDIYADNAVHVTSERTVQGKVNIRTSFGAY